MADLRMNTEATHANRMADLLPRTESPIVPKHSIAGRALVAVVAIMTFLAALTIGAVMLVRSAALEWQAEVAREVTIQVRPRDGEDIEADVNRAVEVARAFPGIGEVRAFSRQESERLLEPWLGSGLALEDLPVPRMIVVRAPSFGTADFAELRRILAERAPGATLDDHRVWTDRMRAMAQTFVVAGVGVLLLVLAATILSVTFATHGAMATNRPIVEVLHFIGAKDSFISGQFQRHFLLLGLEGGAIGGGLAMLLFGLASIAGDLGAATAGANQLAILFGTFSLGTGGYLAICAQIVSIAVITALASRRTVNRTLETVE